MKVLHLSSESTWRGGEQQIIYLVEETTKLGVDAIVGCRERSKVEEYCVRNKIRYFSLPFRSAYDLKTARKIKKYCQAEGVDLIQTHTSKSHTMAVLAGLLGLKTPQILTRRVDFSVKKNWPSRFKYNYKRIKAIICISQTIYDMTYPDISDKSKLVTVHSGVDVNKFDTYFESDWLREIYHLDPSVVCIGNTSAIADQKDYFTFVRVAKEVVAKRSNLHFFIIGDGPEREKIKKFVNEMDMEKHVTFTGFVENIVEVLPALDIFLFTSKTEGLGTSVLDAMAAKVPIVATNAGGVGEMISNAENGLLLEPTDVKGLAESLARMIDSQELREKMVDGASQTVSSFSKTKTAKRTVEVYEQVLSEKA